MTSIPIWSFFTTLLLFMPQLIHNTLVVTSSGQIKGIIVTFNGRKIRTFLGIPYAKPPIGELRFKKPVPVEPSGTFFNGDTLPPGCVQYSSNPFPWLDDLPGLSEDCLYLNIWAPENSVDGDKKVVMFWIHGGGFSISSSRLDFYSGQALAAKGDVIVVTVNYRLGVFGFLYSGTDDAPGNVGALDLVEALKWTRKNIHHFGGDKDSITLFGQSAGGIAIGMFAISPLTRGFFNRAIMQSGSPANLDAEDNEKYLEVSKKLFNAFDCETSKDTRDSVACLRRVPAFELAKKAAKVTKNITRPFYPRYGDEFLPRNARKAIINRDFASIDLLIGNNNGDGATLLTKSMKDVFGFFGEKDSEINFTFGESIIKNKFKDYCDSDSIVDLYLGVVDRENGYETRFQVFTSLGDFSRICPSVYFAESFARKHSNVYFYYFTHVSSNTPWAPWMLAAHFAETPYVFGYPLRYPENYTEEEQKLSSRMIEAWTSFAKIGIPSEQPWPIYSQEEPRYRIFDIDTFGIGYGPHRKNCDFFRSFFGF